MQAIESENKKANRYPKRMVNLELLRCLAMMMVILLHYLDKGNNLPHLSGGEMTATGIAAWIMEAFCIVAVNVYMLISGYFLSTSSWKMSRLLKLWLQIWSYSVVVGVLAVYTGMIPVSEVDTHYYLTLLFPVSMGHYWFMTAYVFLYLLLPLLGMGLRNMTKEQMQLTLAVLLGVFSLIKTVLPVRLELDGQGMDCLWYVCVFVTAAYIRRFGIKFLEKKAIAISLYVAGCLGIVTEAFLLRQIYLRTGSLGRMLSVSFEYNHLLPFLAAVGLFSFFLQLQPTGKMSVFFAKIAPYTLGVYLLHENQGVRYAWEKWFGTGGFTAVGSLVGHALIAVLGVFACGILVEIVRTKCMQGLHVMLSKVGIYSKLIGRIEKIDSRFQI